GSVKGYGGDPVSELAADHRWRIHGLTSGRSVGDCPGGPQMPRGVAVPLVVSASMIYGPSARGSSQEGLVRRIGPSMPDRLGRGSPGVKGGSGGLLPAGAPAGARGRAR